MEAKVCRKEIQYGKNRFKTDGESWQVLTWGWHGPSCVTPSYRFISIPKSKVPEKVLREA